MIISRTIADINFYERQVGKLNYFPTLVYVWAKHLRKSHFFVSGCIICHIQTRFDDHINIKSSYSSSLICDKSPLHTAIECKRPYLEILLSFERLLIIFFYVMKALSCCQQDFSLSLSFTTFVHLLFRLRELLLRGSTFLIDSVRTEFIIYCCIIYRQLEALN